MNKHLHRIVFNAARGLRMVVQETAKSTGRGARKATGGGAGVGSAAVSVAAIAAALMSAPLHAQIVADPNAPGGQRPTVLGAPNGVPLVNIQTPSAAGVSRNTYSQFDVQRNGVILNNSRTNVQSQLGGYVSANPWVATGSARVILNEVNSASPSQLRGYVEVAGPRTEVIIANPAGIQVDGGGFINASRATLTTGTPQFNAQGGLDSFVVRGGNVSIDGAGLDAAKTDYAAILARAVQVNAGIWANELKVATGANQVSADGSQVTPTTGNGTAPSFALDVAALGGMYAGKITLVGTEAGVGVRNAGHIGAGAGGLVVTAAGRLENTGTLEGSKVELSSASDIDNRGGTIRQAGTREIAITAPVLSNTNGGVIGAEPVAATTGSSGSTGTDGGASSGGDASGGSGGSSSPSTTTTATASPAAAAGGMTEAVPVAPPAATGAGAITAGGAILNDGGRIYVGGPIALQTPSINNDGGTLHVASMALSAPVFSNASGTVTVANAFSANLGTFNNAGGNLQAGSISIATTGDLNNQGGTLFSSGTTDLTVGGGVNNVSGTVSSMGASSAAVAGALDNTSGQIVGNNALTLAAGSLNNTLGAVHSAGGPATLSVANQLSNDRGSIGAATDLSIHAASLSNTGTLRAEHDNAIDVVGMISNDGSVTSGRQTTLAAGILNSSSSSVLGAGIKADGTLGAGGDLLVSTSGSLKATGTLLAAGNITARGSSADLTGGGIGGANVSLAATLGHVITTAATVTTPGTLTITANAAAGQSLVNDAGVLSAGRLDLHASNIQNGNGGQIVQTGTDAVLIASAGALNNSGGTIASNGDLSIAVDSLINQGGQMRSAGTASLDITTTGLLDNSSSGVIGASGNVVLDAGRLSNDAGSITAVGDLRASVSGAASNVGGTLAANLDTVVAAASLDNTLGTVAAVQGGLTVTTTGVTTNTQGALQAAGRVALANAGLVNTQGKATGHALSVDTNSGALTNTLGTLAATTTIDLQSGALNNDKGLVQSGGALTVDTHGQSLMNTNAAGHASGEGGIASGDTLALSAGAVDNTAGFIGAKNQLTATIRGLTNAAGGMVLGQSGVTIQTNGAAYDNRGGKTLAVGNLLVDAGLGTVRNSGALIRSGAATTVSAGAVDNTSNLGADQGIEGKDVVVSATNLNNNAGAIRADVNATVTSAGTVSNINGLMSAGDTLRIADPYAASNPGAKTLAVVNTGGTLTAGQSLQLASSTFSGDGTLTSGRDLSLALNQDLVNNATVSADGSLTYATTGTLTNNGKLLAGGTLTVSGRDVENTAAGEMRGDTTVVTASGTLTNRGLIDGHDTRIDAGALVNAPTGRIYGDQLSISAGSILNDAYGASAGTIAARDTLDIGAGSITNRNGALIFSAGDMFIGGALDANRQATGATSLLENRGGTIEALGDIRINAGTLNNLNGGVTWTTNQQSEQVVEFMPSNSNVRFKASEVLTVRLATNNMDGTVSWRAVPMGDTGSSTRLLIPSPSYPLARFAAYYAASPALSVDFVYELCNTTGDNGSCYATTLPGAWYGASDPIWATFGVTAPARDLPSDSSLRLDPNASVGQIGVYGIGLDGVQQLLQAFDHPVTQAEYDEAQAFYAAHANLDAATRQFTNVVYAGTTVNPGTPNGFYRDYTRFNYTVTTETPVLATSNPGRIISGGDMTLAVGTGTNDMSQILAGATLSVTGGAIVNQAMEVQATTTASGTAYASYVSGSRRFDATAYNPATAPVTVTLAAARLEGNLNVTSGKALGTAGSVTTNANTSAAGAVGTNSRVNPIVEVVSAVGGAPGVTGASGSLNNLSASAGQSLVVRTATPDGTVPTASLFRTSPGAGTGHLVETDPAFVDYRTWLNSDYLLNAVGSDPTVIQKRLGDGFYEQRLIREQVAQLTGYRYLEGFQSDEAQYAALMDAGATFAKAYQLTPGIALTAAQMAQLTSDIVWLVEQTVTLADGSTEKVLVPQVYVRVKPGDLDGSGALLSADALVIKNTAGQGDLVNSGTIAGRALVSITADNVQNLGGRITGGSVDVSARNDLNILGGTIDAQNSAVLSAGRDLNIASTTQTAVGAQGSSTQLDRLAGVYVTNPGGTLVASAGHDVNLIGAILTNTGAGGVTSVTAGNDINLGTVQTSSSQDTTWNAKNYSRTTESAEIGSSIVTNGTTLLNAGNDINVRQGVVDAGDGLLSVNAARDINITAGQSTLTFEDARRTKSKGFLTKKTRTTSNLLDETTSQGSSLSGGIVSVTAGNNIAIEGSAISGTDGVLVHAGNVLSISEARDSRSESSSSTVKKSGFAGSVGGLPLPMGAGSRDAATSSSNTAVVSTITSAEGGVLLQGDGVVLLQGVKVDAAKDITIQGGAVSIVAATDYTSSSSEHYTRGTNIGASLWHDPGKGIDAKNTDLADQQASGLDRTVLNGANVSITATGADGAGGILAITGTTVNTPGTLTLSADTLVLGTQTTQTDVSSSSQGGDWAWQKAKGEGTSDQATQYNQLNVGALATNANSVQAGLGARDSLEALAQQPGMAWISQLNSDPALAGKVDWVKVEEAHKNWDYSQQGLTPAAAAVVTLVVAYFTAGAASGWGAAAGDAAATSATGGVAVLGEGGFIAAGGVTISTVVGGAVTAGISALAGQAAVALINNQGDIGGALRDLGSSANVHSLLTAIATGGVLGGLNLNPTGLPTTGAGGQGVMAQLGQNLQAGVARAVIDTAINGGSLEDSLKASIKTAFIDTLAAQGADQIGTWTLAGTLNDVTNKIAHAIAGCAIGAAKAADSDGCGPGALGAAIGELSAELYGRNIDTVQFASMMSGIAAAIAGGDAAAINLASQTGANAAANNYLNHDQWKKLSDRLNSCVPGPDCDAVVSDFQKLSADQDKALVAACQDINSGACRATLAVAVEGTATQKALATAGKLPASYLAGGDFNANANLYAKSAFMSDLRTECARNPICDQKKTESLLRLGSAALDFVPVIGDVKAYVEAESPFDYLLATIGIAGPVGDGVAKALREGRVLYKAGDVAGSTAKLAEAKSLQEVATTIGAMPTGSGFINKTLLNKEASVLNTATLDQRTIISDVVANGDRTGVKTEALVNNVFSADPSITVLGGTKYGSNNGLDHVVQFTDPQTGKTMTMVIDSKQLSTRGTTGLDSSAAGAAMQLSDTSLQAVIERLGGTPAANAISDALDGGTLLKAVAYIDKTSGELKIVRVLN